MNEPGLEAVLRALLDPAQIRANAPLAPLTTFRVGGPADWLIDVSTTAQLTGVLRAAGAEAVPVTVLGGGSNVVIADEGVRGIVLRVQLNGISQPDPAHVRAEAGVTINGLVRWTISHGLAGLEAWAGTPGTVGGAIYGNAHFGGRNIGDLLTSAMLVTPTGDSATVPAAEMEFAYDTSRLKRTREVLAWAEFAVVPSAPDSLRKTARESLAYRKGTQPLAMPSAGCVFQNPDPSHDRLPDGLPWSAGALVDRAGLKGHRIGGARISSDHANFIVNDGHATARDIRALVERAREAVRERFGVELRDEVVFLG
ncbi:MAG TPA: UDP-N-acetylmuramate dehydrogenase [Vicinamibacterales bacterium]|nr:UDP-N-acetylmuramate dehydrogenase [Vicinamibacterales bacterium]